MQQYTVCGYYDESGQIFCHHVYALNDCQATVAVATDHDDAVFTNIISGHVSEGDGIFFPGDSVVDASTVLCQPDVFGEIGNAVIDHGEASHVEDLSDEGVLRYQALYKLACDLRELWLTESVLLKTDIDQLVGLCNKVTPTDLIRYTGIMVIIEYVIKYSVLDDSIVRQFPETVIDELDGGDKVYRYHNLHGKWEVFSILPSGSIVWAAHVESKGMAEGLVKMLNAQKDQ